VGILLCWSKEDSRKSREALQQAQRGPRVGDHQQLVGCSAAWWRHCRTDINGIFQDHQLHILLNFQFTPLHIIVFEQVIPQQTLLEGAPLASCHHTGSTRLNNIGGITSAYFIVFGD
jgi:hypothetical protein